MVYVINIEGKALMPTSNVKARILLKNKKAIVKELKPFTIQLIYKTKTQHTQEITLGIDVLTTHTRDFSHELVVAHVK